MWEATQVSPALPTSDAGNAACSRCSSAVARAGEIPGTVDSVAASAFNRSCKLRNRAHKARAVTLPIPGSDNTICICCSDREAPRRPTAGPGVAYPIWHCFAATYNRCAESDGPLLGRIGTCRIPVMYVNAPRMLSGRIWE